MGFFFYVITTKIVVQKKIASVNFFLQKIVICEDPKTHMVILHTSILMYKVWLQGGREISVFLSLSFSRQTVV